MAREPPQPWRGDPRSHTRRAHVPESPLTYCPLIPGQVHRRAHPVELTLARLVPPHGDPKAKERRGVRRAAPASPARGGTGRLRPARALAKVDDRRLGAQDVVADDEGGVLPRAAFERGG